MKPYYETENGKLYKGNCFDIIPRLDLKVDLVLTDTPYGVGFEYDEYDDTLEN